MAPVGRVRAHILGPLRRGGGWRIDLSRSLFHLLLPIVLQPPASASGTLPLAPSPPSKNKGKHVMGKAFVRAALAATAAMCVTAPAAAATVKVIAQGLSNPRG